MSDNAEQHAAESLNPQPTLSGDSPGGQPRGQKDKRTERMKAGDTTPRLRSRIVLQFLLAIWVMIGLASVARADETFALDSKTSMITFALTDTLHAVKGEFGFASGTVRLDPQTGAISGLLTVNATSGHSDSPTRDRLMIRDELKAAVFPTITFAPQTFTGSLQSEGRSTLQVTGELTLLGKSHSITVPMQVDAGGGKATATGTFPVPYVAWGMKDPSLLFLRVGKVVTIGLTMNGTLTQEK